MCIFRGLLYLRICDITLHVIILFFYLWSFHAHVEKIFFLFYFYYYFFLCFQYIAGVKALNKAHFSIPSHASSVGEGISFVTVFTIYNNTPDTLVNSRSSNLVTVGNASYSKSERSMAILNVFINSIQVILLSKTMQCLCF